MENIEAVIKLVELEEIAPKTFIGDNYKTPWRRVYGGQVLSQALYAAYQTTPSDRFLHSIHGYFILTGNIDIPVKYEVDTIRDGGSFSTRRVRAIQNDETIFIMAASFHGKDEGFEHQITMPNVLPPTSLQNTYEQIQPLKQSHPELYKQISILSKSNTFDFRPVENAISQLVGSLPPYRHIWFKTKTPLESDSIALHHQLLTYVSDYNLLTTASLPHKDSKNLTKIFFASLDHSLYIHRPFRIDEWLLYAIDSPSASNGRAFTRGNIFNQSGQLVASVVQEGLMKPWKKTTEQIK